MANLRGQIIDQSHSGGRTVAQCWRDLFLANEAAFHGGKFEEILEDEELTKRMLAWFPERGESLILREVRKVRNRYNRGVLTGSRPAGESFRYRKFAGGTERCTARGVPLRELG